MITHMLGLIGIIGIFILILILILKDNDYNKKPEFFDLQLKNNIKGKFVTAKLLGKEDCRQGWVVAINTIIIQGQSGIIYICEGKPTIVCNPPNIKKS